MKIDIKKYLLNLKTIGFLFVFLFSLLVYYFTLSRGTFFIDAAIYLGTVKEFGIAYPPGFPLYIILAKLWSYLPLFGDNFSARVNFLTSIFASLSSGVLFLIILKLFSVNFTFFNSKNNLEDKDRGKKDYIKKYFIWVVSVLSSLVASFSYSFWYQSTYSETYSLHYFLMLSSLYFVVSFLIEMKKGEIELGKKQKKNLYGVFIFYGLSFANHPMTINLIPVMLWFLWQLRWIIRQNKPFFKKLAIVFFLCGFIPYLYMPIRSTQNPVMDWGNPENISNFVNHVTGRHWTGDSSNFVFLNDKFFKNIGSYFYLVYRQISWIGIFLSFLGFLFLYKKEKSREVLKFLFWVWAGAVFWGTFYVTGEFESWLVPSHLVLIILISVGSYFLSKKIFSLFFEDIRINKKDNFISYGIVLVLLFLIIFSSLKNNWEILDRHALFYPEEVGANILGSVEDGSIIISESGPVLSTLVYNSLVLGNKPNVIFIHKDSFWSPWQRENLEALKKKRDIFLPNLKTPKNGFSNLEERGKFNDKYLEQFIRGNLGKIKVYSVLPSQFDGINIVPHGFVYEYTLENKKANEDNWVFDFKKNKFCHLSLKNIKNFSLRECNEYGMGYGNGSYYVIPKDIQPEAPKLFEEMKSGYAVSYKNLGDVYVAKRDFEPAIFYYDRAINLMNDNFTDEQKKNFYFAMGQALVNTENYKRTEKFVNFFDNKYKNSKDALWLHAVSLDKAGKSWDAFIYLTENMGEFKDDEDIKTLFDRVVKNAQAKQYEKQK